MQEQEEYDARRAARAGEQGGGGLPAGSRGCGRCGQQGALGAEAAGVADGQRVRSADAVMLGLRPLLIKQSIEYRRHRRRSRAAHAQTQTL